MGITTWGRVALVAILAVPILVSCARGGGMPTAEPEPEPEPPAALLTLEGTWRSSNNWIDDEGRERTEIIPKKNKCRSLTVTCFHTNR